MKYGTNPTISIILPVRNEKSHIANCLDSIFHQEGIDKCEVLVIDGMSNDGTRESLAQAQKAHPELRIIDNPTKIVTSALNIGIKQAKAEIIMRMDAHAIYAPDYIAACLRVMKETGAANVGGHAFALPSNDSLVAHAIALAHHAAFGLGGASFRNLDAQGNVETVWPGCFKKEALDKAGPLNEMLVRSEDIELNYRIRKAGYKIYLSPAIKVYYFCRPTIISLMFQRWLDGKGIVQTLWVNAGATRPRHFAPLPATALCVGVVAWGLAALLLDKHEGFHTAVLTAGIGAALYICAALLFSVLLLRDVNHINTLLEKSGMKTPKLRANSVILLPLVFAALHFSYGFGSMAGFIKRR